MAKVMTKANLKEFLRHLEEFTGYRVSDQAFVLAFKKFNEASGPSVKGD